MRRARAAVLAIVAALGLTGCGLDADAEPHAISTDNLPPSLVDPDPTTTTTLGGTPASIVVPVYLFDRNGDEDRLVAVEREVPATDEARDRLAALFAPPTAGAPEDGLTTSIPPDLVVLDASQIDPETKEISIDLSSELYSIVGPELARAFAQIVYTVTDHDDVNQVSFSVEGEPISALDAEGFEREGAVTRADYRPFMPIS